MIRNIIINIIRFAVLFFLQIYILNRVQFSGFVNPYIYVLFVLWLPFETPGYLLLLLCFLMGLMIDISAGTIGYHTIATVLMGYLRFHLLKLIAPRDGYGAGMTPTIRSLGLTWFMKYTTVLVLAHHLALFWLESFKWGDIPAATLRAVASSIFTVILIFLVHFLFVRAK